MKPRAEMPPAAPIEVIRFADPWCWWSWCMEPVVRRLEEVYGDDVAITYRMGGLYEDLDAWMEAEQVDEKSAAEAIQAAAKSSGMPLRSDYLWRAEAKTTSLACLAYKAAEMQNRGLAHRYFRRMLEAFMVEGVHTSHQAYLLLAAEVGLQAPRIRHDMSMPGVRRSFELDRLAMRQMDADYDGLVLRHHTGRIVAVTGLRAQPYEEAIDELVPGLPKRRPMDIVGFAERRGTLVPREVAVVFRIPEDVAKERLRALAGAGLLEAAPWEGGPMWRWTGREPDPLPIDLVRAAYVPEELPSGAPQEVALLNAVQARYANVARIPRYPYRFPTGIVAAGEMGYPGEELRRLPADAVESFSGVAYVFAGDGIERKDTILDVGCGSGTDALLAARRADRGTVYGLDVTPPMVAKARKSAAAEGKRVQILEGNVVSIPLPKRSVDVVTGNGVLRFVQNKAAALREMARVLRPGGRLLLADVVSKRDVLAAIGICPGMWADGLAGAPLEMPFLRAIREAGFEGIKILKRHDYFGKARSPAVRRFARAVGAVSLVLKTTKREGVPQGPRA